MLPKIYPQSHHGISLQEIDRHALYILEKLHLNGFQAYLVGGSVRDLLLGQSPKDFDISTSAKPEEIKSLFSNCYLIGKRFRLAHIRFGRKILEVATFRTGDSEDPSFITRDNVWGSPEEDVKRRDFTINGLFYDSEQQTIIDYVGGYDDIHQKHLVTIGHPYTRFMQDPVRMIRLIKFRARFGLSIDEDTKLALMECKGEIVKSSQARIFEELLRMLESGFASPFFKLMADFGVLQYILPELSTCLETATGEEIYTFLETVDITHKAAGSKKTLHRAVLLASLVFPFFQEYLKCHYFAKNHSPHLGLIQQESLLIIDKMFHPFFRMPRRLKATLSAILTLQYKLTPQSNQKKRRIPHTDAFDLSLHFLGLRAQIEPALGVAYEEWHMLYASKKPREKKHGKAK